MTKEISRYQDDAHAESLARHCAEEKCRQLDGDLATARTQEVKRIQQIKHLSSKVKRLRMRLGFANNEGKKALTVLYRLSPGPHPDEDDENLVE